ncbi:ATP-binding protein [Clostridium estertheticum]|uniref:ATP-binding protein n=1 Tax=Clostridium estertheticum TaxID=238834 RepID=UPI00124C3347|nr:ATP-binding protein [Clostridium estertheticum]MBZ9615939.1 ATP-binding protein [Clostridium estertheticum subsp. laramiense]WAG75807.1 ATP-binding protein [Clostridium estertheticum]
MNLKDTMLSVELVIETNEVPLIVGESGIGKTALAKTLSKNKGWSLVIIDGNLLKEGEIGGLPTVEDYSFKDINGKEVQSKSTVYAVHTKLQEIDKLINDGKEVFLFIDEINRCEHTVQQELMNLILNREINGYKLDNRVKILAAMNPSSKYGEDFDYQVVDMDAAQENRFVLLHMECDSKAWISWAIENNLEQKVIEFISTFPEYLLNNQNDEQIRATPRSYERVSKVYKIYKENKNTIPKRIFLNIIKGNIGNRIANEFMSFTQEDNETLISFDDVFAGEVLSQEIITKMKNETHTRLYLTAKNIIYTLDNKAILDSDIKRFIELLGIYPVDLGVGIMQDIKESSNNVYKLCLENEAFVEMYFKAYNQIKG